MRLVTYACTSGRSRVGIMPGEAIIDSDRALRAAAEMRHRGAGEAPQLPTEMVAFFDAGPRGHDLSALALELAAEHGPALSALDGVSAVLPADTASSRSPRCWPGRRSTSRSTLASSSRSAAAAAWNWTAGSGRATSWS
jgi:hypothetical protein